jgi:hypothetical protein
MARALGLFGFTGGFLVISPELRQTLVDLANSGMIFVQSHSPYSYAGIALVAFGGVTVTVVSGSRLR